MLDNTYMNKITDLIDKGDFTDSEILKLVLKNIANYSQEKLEALKKEVYQDVRRMGHPLDDSRKIYTALVKNQFVDKKSSGQSVCFHPVEIFKGESGFQDGRFIRTKRNDFVGVFFKSAYDEFIKVTDQNTESIKIQIKYKNTDKKQESFCSFLKSNIFIESEQIFKKLYEQYGFEEPFIYSPYARRYAEIRFTDSVAVESIEKIYFVDDEVSSLIEATTLEKSLVWNIKFKGSCVPDEDSVEDKTISKFSKENENSDYRSNEYIIPHLNGKNYTYKSVYKCKPNEYILFEGVGKTKIGIGRKDDLLYVLSDGVTRLEALGKMIVDECNDDDPEELEPTQVFQNYYSPTLFIKQRLYSYADICYVVNGFNGNPYGIDIDVENIKIDTREHMEQIEGNHQNKYIADYNTFDRYYESANPKREPYRTIRMGSKAACILTFNRTSDFNGNMNFIEDYARYVLAYLNEKYPEFFWKGKRGWLE